MTADATAMLYEYRPKEFTQVSITELNDLETKFELEPMTESSKDFFIRERRNADRYKKQDLMSKYGSLILICIFILATIVIFATQVWQPMLTSMDGVSKGNVKIAESNGKIAGMMNITAHNLGVNLNADGKQAEDIKQPVNKTPVPY